jgi:DNA invertase Pin-like site-specific DNA recombinase
MWYIAYKDKKEHNMKPTVVDIYCRSTTTEQGYAARLAAQEADCRAYCETRGFAIGMVHHEVASGDTYHTREQLTLMRRRYRQGAIRGVIITDLYRLSRTLSHIIILVHEMQRYNTFLHCVRDDLDDTPMGEFIELVMVI